MTEKSPTSPHEHSWLRTLFFAGVLLLATGASTAYAQDPFEFDLEPDVGYWFDVFYPKLFYTNRDGFGAGLYFAIVQPLHSDQYTAPEPYRAALSFDGQATSRGSWFVKLEARAPAISDVWRLTARFVARRRANDSYFGLGNSTAFDADNITDAQPNFYRADRTRYYAQAHAERTIIGPIRVFAGLRLEKWRVAPKDGPSIIANDLALGTDPAIGVSTTEFSGRVGLLLDTRDDEVAPQRGILLEAYLGGADSDIGGDLTYTRKTVSGSGYLPVTPRLQLAARVVGQQMGGTPSIGSFYVVEAGDRAYEGLGGSGSHRALQLNRYLGRDKLFANIDVRYTLFAIPTLYRISVLGFFDAGRVFQEQPFRVTTEGMKAGGGAGLFIQLGRAGILGWTLGIGPDGASSQFHTRWTF